MDRIHIPKTHDQSGAQELASWFKELAKELGPGEPVFIAIALTVIANPADTDLLQVSLFGNPDSPNNDHFLFMKSGEVRRTTQDPVTNQGVKIVYDSWDKGVRHALIRIGREYDRLAEIAKHRSSLVSSLCDQMYQP